MYDNELFLGVMEMMEAKDLKAKLKKENIDVDLRVNEQTCTRGCKVTVEVWGSVDHRDQLVEYFQSEHQRFTQGLEINPELLSQVFDSNAEHVKCQACGFEFSPKINECPDCGLVY